MLKNLKRLLGSEKKDKSIFDIIIYGSSLKKEKPNDIDIVVIFLHGSLKSRLDKIQEIKSRLKKVIDEYMLDIKQMQLTDLFNTSFFARTGILLEGVSVFRNKKFCEILGFGSYTLFLYNLKSLTHTQKVKFNYILAGRNSKGMIEELEGKRLVNGAVKIPIKNAYSFEEILKNNNVSYSKKNFIEEI